MEYGTEFWLGFLLGVAATIIVIALALH